MALNASSLGFRELRSGKMYHCSMLYNYHQGRKETMDDDHKLSLKFVTQLDRVLKEEGFNKNYYYGNSNLGEDLFEMNSKIIHDSEKIIGVFTRGFIQNCWHKYTNKSVFSSVIDSGEKHRFIPVAIGLDKIDLPTDIGIKPEKITYFNDDWEADEASWVQLLRHFEENYHMQENVSSDGRTPVQAVGSLNMESLSLDTTDSPAQTRAIPYPVKSGTYMSAKTDDEKSNQQDNSVTDKDLDRLASELPGQGWQPFMRELLTNETVTKIIENYKNDVHEQIFHCLKKWKQGHGVKATKEILRKALKENDLNLASQKVFGVDKDDQKKS